MAKKASFSGVIFLGFGTYFLLRQYDLQVISYAFTWPTLLLITGIGFLVQAYWQKNYEVILPGIVLSGLGIHFHVVHKLEVWPDHAGVFLLIVALGLLLTYIKTGSGLLQGLLFLAAALFVLFLDRLAEWAAGKGHDLSLLENFWPFLFIVTGIYFLFAFKKK